MTNATAHRRAMWRAIRSYVLNEGYEREIDNCTVVLTDAEWNQLLDWIIVSDAVLAEKPAKPLPIIKERIGYTS